MTLQARMGGGEEAVVDWLMQGASAERGTAFEYRDKYWLTSPYYSNKFGAAVMERWKEHALKWSGVNPLTNAVWAAYRTYHGLSSTDIDSTSPQVTLTEEGAEGEYLALAVNHYRGIVRHQLSLVTAERPAWDPQARTSGSEATKQVRLCRNLLDYVMSAKRFDQKIYDQMELAVVAGAGFCFFGWDAAAGLDGKGDVWCTVGAPWEACHEDTREYSDCGYWIFIRWERRWDWVAQLAESDPEKAEKVASLSVDQDFLCGVRTSKMTELANEDRIPVLYVYANASRALPKGRMAIIAGADLVLQDGPNPYGAVSPVTRICAAEFLGTSRPLANSWSQLPIMEAFNAVVSAIMTRFDIGSVPDVAVPAGSEYEQGAMGGANRIEVDPSTEMKPGLIDLLQIPDVLPKLLEAFKSYMEELSGINSVTRGNPSANITSGSMAALIAAQAVQFNSSDERSYTFALEASGNCLLRIYQRMPTEEQLIQIAGQDERWAVQSFQRDDLADIMRVAVKTTTPYLKTLAGRKEIATELLQAGMIQDPREFIAAIDSGEMSPLFKGPVDQLVIVKAENERMRRGESVMALVTDNPELHIREHICELDTDARYDEAYRARLLEHIFGDEKRGIQGHYMLWQKTSMETPDVCVAFGYRPLPGAVATAQQAAAMGGGGGPPTQPSTPPQKLPNSAEPRAKPGPSPQPRGQEPSQAAPSPPKPAEPPQAA
jgi:hypothetical protein